MFDKKLTDSEIVKALEDFINHNGYCVDCPSIMKNALDLINRLQAENEQLTKDKENLVYSLANAVGQKMTAKAEAYKEFGNKLERVFSKTESQMPNSKVVKQTVQICRNAVRIVINELVGDK